MAQAASASAQGITQATPKEAWAISGPVDPTRFYPKSGPLPAVVGVEGQTGAWDTVGRSRKLLLSDGGHVVETITDADSPNYFAYELTDFQKLFGAIVDHARAEWRFERVEHGTSITWTYTFFAKRGSGWLVALIVRLLWSRYMTKVLPPIVREVDRQAAAPAHS